MALDKINNKLEKQKLLTENTQLGQAVIVTHLKQKINCSMKRPLRFKTNRVNERTNRSR